MLKVRHQREMHIMQPLAQQRPLEQLTRRIGKTFACLPGEYCLLHEKMAGGSVVVRNEEQLKAIERAYQERREGRDRYMRLEIREVELGWQLMKGENAEEVEPEKAEMLNFEDLTDLESLTSSSDEESFIPELTEEVEQMDYEDEANRAKQEEGRSGEQAMDITKTIEVLEEMLLLQPIGSALLQLHQQQARDYFDEVGDSLQCQVVSQTEQSYEKEANKQQETLEMVQLALTQQLPSFLRQLRQQVVANITCILSNA